MNRLDEEIREALLEEQTDLIDIDEDWEAHYEGLKTLFRGRNKWLAMTHLLLMVIFVSMILVSGFKLYFAEDVHEMIGWATALILFTLSQGLLELFFMIEWDKYVLRRDVKQLALQVAMLSQQLEERFHPADEAT